MGLDLVELAIDYEEAFGIEITEEVLADARTPGAMIDYIEKNQAAGSINKCLPMRAFYKIRQALTEEGFIERGQLKLDTDLRAIIPSGQQRHAWDRLRDKHGLLMPQMQRPPWMQILVCLIPMIMAAIIAYTLRSDLDKALILFCVTWVLGFVILNMATLPLASRIRTKSNTPRKLSELLSQHRPECLTERGEILSREQIAETVRAITTEYCVGVEYREDADFIRDLGLG